MDQKTIFRREGLFLTYVNGAEDNSKLQQVVQVLCLLIRIRDVQVNVHGCACLRLELALRLSSRIIVVLRLNLLAIDLGIQYIERTRARTFDNNAVRLQLQINEITQIQRCTIRLASISFVYE